MSRKLTPTSIIVISTIFAATIVTLTGFGNFGIAQGQGNLTLTPEQKAAICDPNNPLSKLDFVNTTESRICGIPKTITNTTSSNMTTGAEEPPSEGIAPSAVPPPPEPEPEPEG
jgi:cell division protein FtsN